MKSDSEDNKLSKTKKAVRKAFVELAETKGITEISVSELSERAGINRTTFYLHYKCIEDVYNEIVVLAGERCRSFIEASRETLLNLDFLECARNFVGYYDANFGFEKIMADSPFASSIKNIGKFVIRDILVELYMQTEIREIYGSVSEFAITGLASGVVSMIVSWIRSDRSVPLEDVCSECTEIVLYGIGKRGK